MDLHHWAISFQRDVCSSYSPIWTRLERGLQKSFPNLNPSPRSPCLTLPLPPPPHTHAHTPKTCFGMFFPMLPLRSFSIGQTHFDSWNTSVFFLLFFPSKFFDSRCSDLTTKLEVVNLTIHQNKNIECWETEGMILLSPSWPICRFAEVWSQPKQSRRHQKVSSYISRPPEPHLLTSRNLDWGGRGYHFGIQPQIVSLVFYCAIINNFSNVKMIEKLYIQQRVGPLLLFTDYGSWIPFPRACFLWERSLRHFRIRLERSYPGLRFRWFRWVSFLNNSLSLSQSGAKTSCHPVILRKLDYRPFPKSHTECTFPNLPSIHPITQPFTHLFNRLSLSFCTVCQALCQVQVAKRKLFFLSLLLILDGGHLNKRREYRSLKSSFSPSSSL